MSIRARETAAGDWTPAARHFGELMARMAVMEPGLARTVGALAVEQMLAGNVCVDLSRRADGGRFVVAPGWEIELPPMDELTTRLSGSGVAGAADAGLPLILDEGGRLYLRRQWSAERRVASALNARLAKNPATIDPELEEHVAGLFPNPAEADRDQVAAVARAMRNRFTVITGGPGTGKTWTVGVLIAALIEEHPAVRIELAAPTGKAAMRLQESATLVARGRLKDPARHDRVPAEARTLHRLLGARPGGGFSRGPANPIAADCVIVDEASMVDLGLMAALVGALPQDAALVLVGDRDQLASVESGSVLGDIARTLEGRSSPALARLTRNHRSEGADDLVAAAEAVRRGDSERLHSALATADGSRGLRAASPATREEWLSAVIAFGVERFAVARDERDAAARLDALSRFRILSPRRDGFLGVRDLNERIESALRERGWMSGARGGFVGQPLLILENDYGTRLFNGDLGVVVEQEGRLMVAFPGEKSAGPRLVSIDRLPRHETAFAMTIHKSQGSEFDEVLLVLPDAEHPLLTRELLYTGLTRARRQVEVRAAPGAWEAAAARRTHRDSGLSDLLVG